MKRSKRVYLGLALALCLVYPLLLLLGECFGYEVIVRSWGMHGLLFTALFVFVSTRALRSEEKSRAASILAAFLLPASAIHAFTWTIGRERFWLAALLSLVWVGFSIALMVQNTKAFAPKLIASILSVFLMLPTLAGVLLLPFTFGYRATVQTVTSPERNYRAEIVDVNQGALGGDTIVEVYDLRKQWDTVVFLVRKVPQEAYFGDWGEFQTMKIQWESEQILRINGRPYEVD